MQKILFLYCQPYPVGLDYTRNRNLIQALKANYDLDLRFGIWPDDGYSEIKHPEYKDEVLSESAFFSGDYDVVYIEEKLYVTSDRNASKVRAHVLKQFRNRHGIVIFNFNERSLLLNSPGIEVYNEFLNNAGLPQFKRPRSYSEFPDFVSGDISDYNNIVGYDKNSSVDESGLSFYVNINEETLDRIAFQFRPIYQGLSKLFLESPLQLERVNKVLIPGNTSTHLLSSDCWWDGSIPAFGVCNDLENGYGVLITGGVGIDELIEKYESDNIQFILNLISTLLLYKAERKELNKDRLFIDEVSKKFLDNDYRNYHPNLTVLINRMEAALERNDYANVLHASASIFETMAKNIVGIPQVQEQTLKAFFQRYRKDSNIPNEKSFDYLFDYMLQVYESRNKTPLAGHGSTHPPNISQAEAVILLEVTKAIVRSEYKLRDLKIK